jgi:hypothetical protein
METIEELKAEKSWLNKKSNGNKVKVRNKPIL